MHELLEIATWMLISIFKFLFTPSAMIASGYSFWQTATVTMAGGSIGVVVFYYAGEGIYLWWRRVRLKRNKTFRKFTKRNRIIVRYKNKFGALGFAACLGFLSVPLCALVASRYFYHNKNTILYLIGSVIVWTFFLSGFSYLIRFIIT